DRYRFMVRGDAGWEPVTRDDLLREREFKNSPLQLILEPTGTGNPDMLRITFGREPVDRPFVLTMAKGANTVAIRADGVGHFTVECRLPPPCAPFPALPPVSRCSKCGWRSSSSAPRWPPACARLAA